MPKKNSKHLTDPGIGKMSKAKKGTRVERFDAGVPGLCLRVTEKGVKTWAVYYKFPGINRKGNHALLNQRLTIGQWPGVGVAEARIQARGIKDQATAGVNPKEAQEAERAATGNEAADTFGAIAEKYISRECLERELENGKVTPPKLKRGWEVERIIRRELMPYWRNRPMAELRKRDAIKRTDALIDAGKPAAAHRLHEIIRRIGRWATRRDEIEINPFAEMDPPAPKVMRERVLSEEEIKELWKGLGHAGYPTEALGKLLLVTAQRLGEVAGMQQHEIDRDAKLWTIPGERTKSGRAAEVPLSPLAIEIIDDLPEFTKGDFMLTTTNGKKPVSGFSKMKATMDERSGVAGWRLHDLRRTARTGLAELGVPQIIAEKVLNHAERNVLVKTYDRHEYAAEKRDALERWATRLREITEPPPENVVKLKARR